MQGSTGSIIGLLPILVAGYVFNFMFLPSRYFSQRVDGQRLLFMSAMTGLVIALVCFAGRNWLSGWFAHLIGAAALESLRASIPMPFGLTMAGILLAAPCLALLMNAIVWAVTLPWRRGKALGVRQFVSRRLTNRFGNSFVTTLRRAADDQKLVMVCLRSRKVYVGSVLEIPADLDKPSHIEILPKFSGYRDKDTLRFERTTEYRAHLLWTLEVGLYSRTMERGLLNEFVRGEVEADFRTYLAEVEELRASTQQAIEQLKSEMSHDFEASDWLKVLVVSDIESINLFDESAYSNWFLADHGRPDTLAAGEVPTAVDAP